MGGLKGLVPIELVAKLIIETWRRVDGIEELTE